MHHGKQEFGCPDCGMVLNTADAVQSHFNRKYKMEPVPNIPEEGSGG